LIPGAFAKVGIGVRIILYAVVAGLLAGGLAIPAVGAVGLVTRNQTNSFNTMKTGVIGQLPVRSEILDSRGHLLAYFYPRGIDREPVSFSQISPIMRKAIVAIEDSRFYQHGAIDIRGTFRALVNDLEHKQVQGGSTLTQQYVKNALILTAPNTQMAEQATSETLSRKLKEYNINFAPGESTASLGFISNEQQKFFRARVQTTVTIRNSHGEEVRVQGVNLSTGGMGLDGIKEPLRFAGLLDVSFPLPEGESIFQAKARIVWSYF